LKTDSFESVLFALGNSHANAAVTNGEISFKSFFGVLWGSKNLQFFGLTIKLAKAANLLLQLRN